MKIVFLGTPEFAKNILEALYDAGHEITAVFTQPDKPKGRSGELIAPPVKEYAASKNIPVYQPEKIKRPESVETLKSIAADVYVVAAYGQILSEEILNIPKYGCVNVHGSLLPKYRGAAPIQRAIANGEQETGVTIMQMDKGMDTGAILAQELIEITPFDTEETMYEKMAEYGIRLLLNVLDCFEAGSVIAIKQDNDSATYAPMLTKEDGFINFKKSAESINAIIRGYKSWPTAYTYFGGKLFKIYEATVCGEIPDTDISDFGPGTLVVLKKDLYVVTGEGVLLLNEVQLEGKKRMSAMDFARGVHLTTGECLGR